MPYKQEDLDKEVLETLEQAKSMTGGLATIPIIERIKQVKALEQEKLGNKNKVTW